MQLLKNHPARRFPAEFGSCFGEFVNLAEIHWLDRPGKTTLGRRVPQLTVSAQDSGAIESEFISSQHLAAGTRKSTYARTDPLADAAFIGRFLPPE